MDEKEIDNNIRSFRFELDMMNERQHQMTKRIEELEEKLKVVRQKTPDYIKDLEF